MGFAEVLGEVEKSMGILSGLKNLGLGNLENMDVFEGQKKQEAKKPEPFVAQKPQEKDLIYERSFTCPVCDTSFTSKVMKSNKARLLGTDRREHLSDPSDGDDGLPHGAPQRVSRLYRGFGGRMSLRPCPHLTERMA